MAMPSHMTVAHTKRLALGNTIPKDNMGCADAAPIYTLADQKRMIFYHYE
jgi:hypothetical protein